MCVCANMHVSICTFMCLFAYLLMSSIRSKLMGAKDFIFFLILRDFCVWLVIAAQ